MNNEWKASDLKASKHIGLIEFQDTKEEWHDFEVLKTKERIVFGAATNTGFLESGYIIREDGESLDETLQEMLEDLKVYYNDGPHYVSRIVCNKRM